MPANQIDAFMAAISSQESGGNYQARNSRTGAYGRFQIMPANWAPWSREAFGRVVPRTAANQDKVARYKMLQYYRNYGSWDLVAAAWFGGPGAASAIKRGDTSALRRSDGNMTIGAYIDKMRRGMSKWKGNSFPDYDNARALPSESTVPNRPGTYNNSNWAFYDNMFNSVRTPQHSAGLPDPDDDEFEEDNVETMLYAALDEMAKAQSDTNQIEDLDSLAPILDDTGLDEDALALPIGDEEDLEPGELPTDIPIGTTAITEDDEERFQAPLYPLDTPYDPQSASTRKAFAEIGRDRALQQPGDLGIPADAPPDVIPPRLLGPRDLKNIGSSAAGSKIVDIAKKYLGIPYLWGGTNPKRGLDCSGLMQLIFKQVGVNLPRVSRDQARAGKRVNGLQNARPGDLVAFSSARVGGAIGHIGMYIGNGMMIEAPRTGLNVRIASLKGRPPTVIRRVL